MYLKKLKKLSKKKSWFFKKTYFHVFMSDLTSLDIFGRPKTSFNASLGVF